MNRTLAMQQWTSSYWACQKGDSLCSICFSSEHFSSFMNTPFLIALRLSFELFRVSSSAASDLRSRFISQRLSHAASPMSMQEAHKRETPRQLSRMHIKMCFNGSIMACKANCLSGISLIRTS